MSGALPPPPSPFFMVWGFVKHGKTLPLPYFMVIPLRDVRRHFLIMSFIRIINTRGESSALPNTFID